MADSRTVAEKYPVRPPSARRAVVWLLAVCVCSLPGGAGADAIRSNQIRETLNAVCKAKYPELDPAKISIKLTSSIEPYARVLPTPSSLFSPRANRGYEILLHPRVLRIDVGAGAVEALLAHELAHVFDYSRRSGFSLLVLSIRYLISGGFRRDYERETDKEAIRRGYGPGLKIYRDWMASRLKPKQLKKKMRLYLSPDEISAEISRAGGRAPREAGRPISRKRPRR